MDTANGRAHVIDFLHKLHCSGTLNSIGKVALKAAGSADIVEQSERILNSTFAASFTRSDRNREMINAYAGLEGCCIGFNGSFVDEIQGIPSSFDDGGSHFSFHKMTYDFDSQRAKLLQVYEEFSRRWDPMSSNLQAKAQELVGQLLYQGLLITSFHFKGSEFEFEDEVRLLFSFIGNHESLSEKIRIIRDADGLVQSCALNLSHFPENINSITIFSRNNRSRYRSICDKFGISLNLIEKT